VIGTRNERVPWLQRIEGDLLSNLAETSGGGPRRPEPPGGGHVPGAIGAMALPASQRIVVAGIAGSAVVAAGPLAVGHLVVDPRLRVGDHLAAGERARGS
jgi:hypothetical protein